MGQACATRQPIDRLAYVPDNALALSYISQGRYEEAANAARCSVQSNLDFSVSHSLLPATLGKLGWMEAAESAEKKVLTLERSFRARKS